MAWPGIFRKLFENSGAGPKLLRSILPFATTSAVGAMRPEGTNLAVNGDGILYITNEHWNGVTSLYNSTGVLTTDKGGTGRTDGIAPDWMFTPARHIPQNISCGVDVPLHVPAGGAWWVFYLVFLADGTPYDGGLNYILPGGYVDYTYISQIRRGFMWRVA